jgi:hypothetical protein
MTKEDQQVIGGKIGALMAAQSFSIYAVIIALAEQNLLSHDRVIAWAETFAQAFDDNPKTAENRFQKEPGTRKPV